MKNSEFNRDSENTVLLGLVREYQAERDNNKKGVILEKVLSRFEGYIRRNRCFLSVEEFKQFIMISFWKSDCLGKYDFVSRGVTGYIMSHIFYCRLRAYNAEKSPDNKLNQSAVSIHGDDRAIDGNDRALIDILSDPNENPEADFLDSIEENHEESRRRELLKLCMPRFVKSGRKIIRAILDNPEYSQDDLAKHCGCSYERTRQVLSKLVRMVRYYEKSRG